jgi:hypothetical protein
MRQSLKLASLKLASLKLAGLAVLLGIAAGEAAAQE